MSLADRKARPHSHASFPSSSATPAFPVSLAMSLSSASDTSRLCATSDTCCRICLSGGKGFRRQPLLNLCKCRGSIGLVHKSCLETWLTVSRSDSCDLCGSHLRLEKKAKPLSCWIADSETRVKCYLLTDLISFLFLTPLTAASLHLCMQGLVLYAKSCFDKAGLLFLISMLIITYILWFATCLVQHLRNWRRWRAHNVVVRLTTVAQEPTASRMKSIVSRGDNSPSSATQSSTGCNTEPGRNNQNTDSPATTFSFTC